MVFQWTKDLTMALIDLVEPYPCLWQIRHKDYKNKRMKDALLKTIIEKLNLPIEASEISKKLHTLRSQFAKEIKYIRQSQESGASPEDQYTPKLWLFDRLQFLMGDVNPRLSGSTYNGFQSFSSFDDFSKLSSIIKSENMPYEFNPEDILSTDTTAESEGPSESRSDSPAASPNRHHTSSPTNMFNIDSFSAPVENGKYQQPNKKFCRKRKIEDTLEPLIELTSKKRYPYSVKSDPCADFGRYVANELSEMSPEARIYTKKLINDALFLGAIGSVNSKHKITES